MSSIKNFIDELDTIVPAKNKHSVIESRAAHIIASTVNLVKLIRETYDPETAADLIKRLHRSILKEDNKKFMRKIKALRK